MLERAILAGDGQAGEERVVVCFIVVVVHQDVADRVGGDGIFLREAAAIVQMKFIGIDADFLRYWAVAAAPVRQEPGSDC